MKEEVLDRSLWRTRLGRGCGPTIRQTVQLMDHYSCFVFFFYVLLTVHLSIILAINQLNVQNLLL